MTMVFDAYATYYDLLYRDKDYEGEANFVQNLLSKHGVHSGRILELGCGTGKHAALLAGMGYSVHGVDMSPAMVEAANARTPPQLTHQLKFEVGDVRTARVGGQFDAVISLFHVASYQTTNDDLLAMFQTAAAHLKSGGIFLFDCWYGPAVLTDRPAVRVKRMENEMVTVMRIAEPVVHPNENVVDVNYSVLVTNRSENQTVEIKEVHRMRYLFAPEIKTILASSGFAPIAMVEWMTGRDLGFNTWSATVVAVRR